MRFMSCTLLVVLLVIPEPVPAWKGDIVKAWARTLGDEVWKLSEALTKSDQIRIKYKQMNASVKKKDGKQILESSLRSVSTMLQRKIKAVKCIYATAQRLAQEFNDSLTEDPNFDLKYCSAKYSNFEYEDERAAEAANKYEVSTPRFAKDNPNYLNISLEKDSHFYDISVNTNISCVHVPTNIYYKEKDALNAILWSKGLNEMFTKNYQSDPSLSWQYFGSSHGILRFYPGMPWNRKEVDTYDCRVKSWYIEAATCSKDVIILFDVSGSMTGFKNYVARRTLESLLDTLSNNDYVNVYTVKNETHDAIRCFDDLVQATPENLNTIKNILEPTDNGKNHKVPLEGNANLTRGYERAFEQLRAKRQLRREDCDVSSTQGCNQLVMVITDYVPGNLSEVFEKNNRELIDGKTYIPVRVFTYLIGKEVTNVAEIRGMACQNRGYFVHIHSVEEVQQQVLKYINVIARPMILEGEDPPPTWTHANIDQTRTAKWDVSSDVDKPDEDKLVTSVAIPAFDLKYNAENNDAMLLGVAGTDVPIDSIAKLAQPHQLGVNGYSFIVSNNGYLLLHPLLRTTINGELQANYNSVDFVEVEQVDDGKGPRELGEEIKRLRESLVDGDHGEMRGVRVLFHYDDMRRIFRVSHNYFFNKLEGTPFSMGISLPTQYGDTELMLKDNPLEAKQGKELTGINVTDYFRFSYRVHPDWVYCKYHYLEGHESDNAEEEIWKFLVNLSMNKTDITKKQYSEEIINNEFDVKKHCEKATPLEKDDYYCNEDLVKQLVFDAKLTTPYFKTWSASKEERDLAEKYNVSVRYIATSSGLTRWHYIFEEDKNEEVDDFGNRHKNYTEKVFGDKYILAIEETWYKAAVLQHMINKESLVVATRLPILDEIIKERPPVQNDDGDITMTASFAIFYKDGESETPASVVGFQYSYLSFQKRFAEITNMTTEPEFTCEGNRYHCYVIDSSGYIVLAKEIEDVGQFFGTLDQNTKFVMQSFLEKQVFEHVDVYNYQALCPPEDLKKPTGNAWNLNTPFSLASNFLRWLVVEAVLLLSNLSQSWQTLAASIVVDDDYDELLIGSTEEPVTTTQVPVKNETIHVKEDDNEKPFSCDHRITLYILNQHLFVESMGAFSVVSEDKPGDCHPRYWASIVSKTNLLLVVVDSKDADYGENCTKVPPPTKPKVTEESRESGEPCHKLELGQLKRRRLEGCFTFHEGERNITACGRGSGARADLILLLSTLLLRAVARLSS